MRKIDSSDNGCLVVFIVCVTIITVVAMLTNNITVLIELLK